MKFAAKPLLLSALATGAFALAAPAQAAFIASYNGNDCAGVFGQGFANCKIPVAVDPNQSPIIIKFGATENGLTDIEINSALFPSVDGSEFSFNIVDGNTGTWTYTPGVDDPNINYFTAKFGDYFFLYSTEGKLTGTWDNTTGNQGLSHLSFYDTGAPVCEEPGAPGCGPDEVPEPGSLLLVGAGLLGYGLVRRRRRA